MYNCRICQIVFFNTKQGVKQFFKRMKRRYSFDDLPVILIKNMLAKKVQYHFPNFPNTVYLWACNNAIAHPSANFWEFRERGEDYRNFCGFVPLENAQSRSIWQNVLSELFSVVGFGLLEGAYLVWSFCVCVCGSALRARGSERKHKSAPRRRHPICQEEKTTKWCAREKKICPVIRSTFFMRAGARKAKCARALRTTKPSIIATIARISGLQHHHDLRAYPSNAAFKINFSWSDRN